MVDLEDEYKRNKDLHEDDLNTLQGWVQKQPHLPPILQLAIFFHSCYWSMEQTKTTIEKFFTYRGAWSDFFANQNPNNSTVKSHMETSLCAILPSPTPENYKIVLYKLMNSDVERFATKEEFKIFDMCMMMELMQKGTSDGCVLVCDLREATVAHALKFDITATRRIMLYLQEALPVRLKGLHFITMAGIVNLLMPLVKPFMKKELLTLLHFHDSYESLCKFLPREILPADLGGKGPTTRELHEDMQKSFTDYSDFFVEQESFVSNESLRDGRPSYIDKDLGVGIGGSFKKLDID
ncbi:alpha-tocopherol transfer protein-like [Photinus pyralis]|uniref:alpha-tocopherol transfer protein-like n=1 Tax=Photinus pyralis TaxID=7054 RepID=UPI001266F890|nr:alpha-tocopherol transfer protein-like [Photinus pyralis]